MHFFLKIAQTALLSLSITSLLATLCSATEAPIVSSANVVASAGKPSTLEALGSWSAKRNGQLLFESGTGKPGAFTSVLPPVHPDHKEVKKNHYIVSERFHYSKPTSLNLHSPANPKGDASDNGGFAPFQFSETTRIFVSYVFYYDPAMPAGDQNKLGRLIGPGSRHGDQPAAGITNFTQAGYAGQFVLGKEAYIPLAGSKKVDLFSEAKKGWVRVVDYIALGTPGVADGCRLFRLVLPNGEEVWRHRYYDQDTGAHLYNQPADLTGLALNNGWTPTCKVKTRQKGVTSGFVRWTPPFWKREYDDLNIYIDDVYINDSFESIWLANASTWSTSTQKVLIPVLTRTTSKITANVELANLPFKDSVLFLYVFNEDGSYNSSGTPIKR